MTAKAEANLCAGGPTYWAGEARWASPGRGPSKGTRVDAPLPLQNDRERLLHGIDLVGLAFHLNEYVFFIPPAARGAATANHDSTVCQGNGLSGEQKASVRHGGCDRRAALA